MDITSFYELRSRLYLTAAAGCAAINEDFRLKRAVEAFEPLSQANKAFGQFYAKCSKLFASENTASDLADCIALADALAVTQGTFSDTVSETEAYARTDSVGINVPYSHITALREKIEHYRDIDEEDVALITDPRIIAEFISCADSNHVYYEELTEGVFRKCGRGIITMLKNSLDLSNEKATGSQVRYVSHCVGAEENEWYLTLAGNENAPQNVRIRAIEALSCSAENTEKLIELFSTEKGKIKNAALMSLAKLSPPEAEPIFKNLLEKYKDSYSEYIAASSYEICAEFAVSKFNEAAEKGNIISVLPLLANKIQTEECFLSIAKEFSASSDSKMLSATDILEHNLNRSERGKYEKLVERLYEREPDFFRSARFFLELIRDPEGAADTEYADISVLFSLRYSPLLNEYVLDCLDHNTHLYIPLFKRLPDNILNLMTDTSRLSAKVNKDKYKETREHVRYLSKGLNMTIDKKSSLADRERVKEKVLQFSWYAVRNYPNMDSFATLYNNHAEGDYKGVITECIIADISTTYSLNECKYIDELIPAFEDKKAEANKLLEELKRIKRLGSELNGRRMDMHIAYVESYLKQLEEVNIQYDGK